MSAERTRTTRVFDWSQVNPAWVARLLVAYGQDHNLDTSAAELRQTPPMQLAATAARHLGRPPSKRSLRGAVVVDLLRTKWLPQQPADTVGSVIELLTVGLRRQAPSTKPQRITYLAGLNRTETLAMALRRAFIVAHKVDRDARPPTMSVGHQAVTGPILLRGTGASALTLYPHQQLAHRALDHWMKDDLVGGVLVLPTGAGKTATAVTWLLTWLAENPEGKVLWLAHQRELVDQSARSFADLASEQAVGFESRLRVIHGGGSAFSTLADADLRVVVATIQTLRPDQDPRKVEALKRYTKGPSIVVVDEAHRASSQTYEALLNVVQAQSEVRIMGLTATPTPSGAAARRRFRLRFPRTLISVDPGELVQQGILARPVFHKVDTHISIEMSAAEVRRSLAVDVPDAILKRLALPARNQLIVDTWKGQSSIWGSTLIFATSIEHAETLAHDLAQAGATVRALHSRSSGSASDTLQWFRSTKDGPVLVSVGMLTEGVDLPGAQTAILARPTTSAVLMRQMVGRVLRGPRANGTAVAHLVTLHDDWVGFTGVIEPIDLKNLPEGRVTSSGQSSSPRSLKLVTSVGEPIPSAILAQIQRLYADHAAAASQGAIVSRADLVGYYETRETRVPVFRHLENSFSHLVRDLAAGGSLQGRPASSYFSDDPLPHPTERGLAELVEEVRDCGAAPELTLCSVVLTADSTAQEIRNAGPLTDDQRRSLLRSGWEDGGFLSYASFDHWHEAVDARLRELGRARKDGLPSGDPEASQPIVAKRVDRNLAVLFRSTVDRARNLLDSGDTLARLGRLPALKWSKRSLETTHAHWTLKPTGPVITVSCALQVSRKHVTDELLRYLLWHELLHHVLPGHGHDAEFRHLEARWPGALDLDLALDTLHERIGRKASDKTN